MAHANNISKNLKSFKRLHTLMAKKITHANSKKKLHDMTTKKLHDEAYWCLQGTRELRNEDIQKTHRRDLLLAHKDGSSPLPLSFCVAMCPTCSTTWKAKQG